MIINVQGTRLQATINPVHVNKFEGRIREMENYIIQGFTVIVNKQTQFKPVDSKLKIVFQYKTIVTDCEPPLVPTYGLNLIDFCSVSHASKNNQFLIGKCPVF